MAVKCSIAAVMATGWRELLAHRKAHRQRIEQRRAKGVAAGPVVREGLVEVDEQPANDEIGHSGILGTNGYRAELILQVVNADAPPAQRLPSQLATAIIGGINELVLQAIEDDRVDRLHELTEPAARLVRAVADHWR